MKKSLIASAMLVAFAAPAFAAEEAPAPEHTLTANAGLFSSYRFRGIDQTNGHLALQGGFDYSHASGLYAGNWNSNVSSGAGYPQGNLESDFYAGYKTAFGDFGLDVGALYYYYSGSKRSGLTPVGYNGTLGGTVDNKELYVGGSWKFLSLKYYHAVADYFGAKGVNGDGVGGSTYNGKGTKGTNYLDLSANFDLGDGLGVNAHYGKLNLKNVANGDYSDWKLGVTKDFSGWVVGASYIGTNAKGSCYSTGAYQPYALRASLDEQATGHGGCKNAGKDTVVLSVSRTF